MTDKGPVFLRWRLEGRMEQRQEQFATLDEALDAVEARWEELQRQAPQILDRRRVLAVTTEELQQIMAAEES
jgi:hypothetical protein